jgi:hypothetical protein
MTSTRLFSPLDYHPFYVFLVRQGEEIQDTNNHESEEDYASPQAQATQPTADASPVATLT